MNKAVEGCASRGEAQAPVTVASRRPSPVTRHAPAFTLIEILTVIGIIAVIAALILPVVGAVKRRAYLQNAQTQMAQIETALASYKAAYGFYPPDNQRTPANPLVNQLYYELVGTTNTAPTGDPEYEVLGDSSQQLSGGPNGNVLKIFGVAGFMNCSKAGADESAARAQDFLPGLKPTQIATKITNITAPGAFFTLLVTPGGGPDPTYQPLGIPDVNPWRYVYPGTNNPNSYDLWIQLVFKPGETNLICNWDSRVQVNSPMP